MSTHNPQPRGPVPPPGDPETSILSQEDVMYQATVERKIHENAVQIATQDEVAIQAVDAAVVASQESHEEVVAAHIEAVESNNQSAADAIAALLAGEPQQSEPLPTPTLPDELPTVVIDIPVVDPNSTNPVGGSGS
jgi:hypothetical protein